MLKSPSLIARANIVKLCSSRVPSSQLVCNSVSKPLVGKTKFLSRDTPMQRAMNLDMWLIKIYPSLLDPSSYKEKKSLKAVTNCFLILTRPNPKMRFVNSKKTQLTIFKHDFLFTDGNFPDDSEFPGKYLNSNQNRIKGKVAFGTKIECFGRYVMSHDKWLKYISTRKQKWLASFFPHQTRTDICLHTRMKSFSYEFPFRWHAKLNNTERAKTHHRAYFLSHYSNWLDVGGRIEKLLTPNWSCST